MKKAKFKELRKLMWGEYTVSDLADYLGKSKGYISLRLNGTYPWCLDDVYRLCDAFDIQPAQIPFYFPREDICKALGKK